MRAIPRRSVISVYSGKERGKLDGGMNEGNSSWRRRFLYVFLELDDTILANLLFFWGRKAAGGSPEQYWAYPPEENSTSKFALYSCITLFLVVRSTHQSHRVRYQNHEGIGPITIGNFLNSKLVSVARGKTSIPWLGAAYDFAIYSL